ncbi:serine/threonine-protein kinase [Streptomyces sp. NPDC005408]|uniref:serine/threonine-protein kinase n=1 Tax=Streptomyces sp. NPDC005408 TaxID=3155341 RepID=UPI0033AE16DD
MTERNGATVTTGDASGGELLGTVIGGRYRVTGQLGRGGMGVVCRAVDEVLGREVAVKILRAYNDVSGPELADLRARMQREAQAAARVRHSSVIIVHDVTEEQGLPVIVMELVEGPSLDDVLAERGAMDPREAAAIGATVMDALDAAHKVGVLHRDVKPGNVLLDRSRGRVVLTDFGIASVEAPDDAAMTKLTQDGMLVGSLDFLPPERAMGQTPGPASDIWSLGMTLYAAVEGATPFRRTSVWSTLNAIVTQPLPELRRSGSLAPVIQALTAKDPAARPSADEARQMLEAVAAGNTMSVTPPVAVTGDVPVGQPSVPAATAANEAYPSQPASPSVAAGFGPPISPQSGPQLGGQGAPFVSHTGGHGRRTAPLPSRRRGRTTIAAATAALVLAGGGIAYALMGPGSDGSTNNAGLSGSTPNDQAGVDGGKTGSTTPKASPSSSASSSSPSASSSHAAGNPAKPSGQGSTSGAGGPTTSGTGTGTGTGTGAGTSGAPSSPASPTATSSSVSKSCGGWSHQDPHPGTYGNMTGTYHLKTGPYATCSDVAQVKSGAKVWYHCYVVNGYGHPWTYVRISGTQTAGWMSNDNLTNQNGPTYRC